MRLFRPLEDEKTSSDEVSFFTKCSQYYLERNLEARERELAREEELEERAPKVKAKSKMSKVNKHLCRFRREL